jgi:hypothetical protein
MLPHDRAEKIAKWLRGWGLEPVLLGPIFLLIVFLVSLGGDVAAVRAFFTALAALSPVWIPLFLLRYFWIMWMYYIRYQSWFNTEHVLLEITLPPEVEKSPLAMEVVLSSLWNSAGEATFIARLWKGNYRPIWSLEIASNEGRVGYYMHLRKSWQNIIEARIYGQFPEAKISVVEDYASKVPYNPEEYSLWGLEYEKQQPGAVPIRTYYEYALDKDTDSPETMVDPISNILEFFSSIGKDEYLWLQIIVKARKKDEWYGFYKKSDAFMEGGKKVIQDMIVSAAKRSGGILKELKIGDPEGAALKQAASRGAGLLSEDERNKLEAVEKSMGKLIFEAGMRGIYLAKKERFNPVNNGGLIRMFDAYRSVDLNALNPTRGLIPFDYPWQDFHDIRKNRVREQLYFHYRNRAYFYVPYDQTPIFFTSEELASLWHFPSSAINPPGLERVAAKRAEAPPGLPTAS